MKRKKERISNWWWSYLRRYPLKNQQKLQDSEESLHAAAAGNEFLLSSSRPERNENVEGRAEKRLELL